MPEQSRQSTIVANLRGLGWPLIIGLGLHAGFFLAIKRGLLDSPFAVRYFTSHPVSHVATGMFFIGLAALAIKAIDLLAQLSSLGEIRLDAAPASGQPVHHGHDLLETLKKLPARLHTTYLWQRLHNALEFVQRKQSADGLDDELKYLSDQDGAQQYESYSLVRILIWATPMMGFLGTVIGITLALENFGKQDFADLSGAMDVLLSSLYIAFDTTALALSLSIILMFMQFVIDRFETQILTSVDSIVSEQLVGRFEEAGSGTDPNVRSIDLMCRSVIQATERLVQQQAQFWKASIDTAQQQWLQTSEQSAEQIQAALAGALDSTLQAHAQRVENLESVFADQLRQRWESGQANWVESTKVMQQQQQELIKQGEVMHRIVQSTGDVINLETTLNDNLKALAGAKNFEDTVMSLTAAIHLITSRLSESQLDARRVELQAPAQGNAA